MNVHVSQLPIDQKPKGVIAFNDLTVSFPNDEGDDLTVISNLNLAVEPGTFVSIVGPSGCGKSTLLRVLAGLVKPASGNALIDGKSAVEMDRRLGFMFQRDTLLPWASVVENIRVGTDLGGYPAKKVQDRIRELVSFLKLLGFENHRPHQLSGGMRQRVSLGRLLAYEPDVFLMDEPFGALDSQTKMAMGRELLRIWAADMKTVVFVTHDIEEAITLSDRVIVMAAKPGRIVLDQPIDLARPRNAREVRKDSSYRDLVDHIWQHIDSR
ncbi:ABC transporter ATP-binding protein [Mesorhizobium sp. 2RAF21]|uniref:ABC transporter ATP-binding protein n=1 Tax=Mesorhizobium sp. 2RAF21 TaxID=3232995 RepID=UPI003F9C0BCD